MRIYITKELFQWEIDREVFIEPECDEPNISFIQFYNKSADLADEREFVEGKVLIPNHLLMDSLPIMVVACTGERGKTKVISRREFKVLTRKRPEYYIEDLPTKEIIYDGGVES